MPEGGFLDRLLGGGGEDTDDETPSLRADPLAAAAALDAAKSDGELNRKLGAYVDRQARLVEVQTDHLHEQRALNLKHMRVRRWRELIQLGLQVFLVVVATVLALGAARMIWEAAHNQRLVVEPFSVPPDLAARGATGQVLAAELLDRLGAINAKASSTRAPSSYAGNWGEEVKVEIPDTGVSIGELQRFLDGWLGHETHITGELVRSPAGLALTVRAGEEPGRTVAGTDANLGDLLQQGAEAAFQETQPYRYAMYLQEEGKLDQSLAVARSLAESAAPRQERAWALTEISGLLPILGDAYGGVGAAEEAERLDPTIATTYFNESTAWYFMGQDERVLAVQRVGLRQLGEVRGDFSKAIVKGLRLGNQASVEDLLGDYAAAADDFRLYADEPNLEGFRTSAQIARSYELARAHDVAGSLAAAGGQPMSDTDGALQLNSWGDAFVAAYERAAAAKDWGGAADDMRRTIAGVPRTGGNNRYLIPRFLQPRLAYALARGGKQAEAEAIAATLATDCYRGLWTRGWVATTARDWPRADREFAAAVRLAPSLPLAYAAWGESLAARGDLGGAVAKLGQAVARGPHYADAFKAWGDVLAREGRWRDALAKYDAALKYAPAWAELHQARDAAARKR